MRKKRTPAMKPIRHSLTDPRLPRLLTLPSMLVIFGVLIIPILYSLFLSFHNLVLSTGEYEFVGFKHYISMFSDPAFYNSVGLTLLFTVLTVSAEIVFGVGFALLLPLFFGLDGVLYSMPAADILTAVISGIIILKTYRQLNISVQKAKSN